MWAKLTALGSSSTILRSIFGSFGLKAMTVGVTFAFIALLSRSVDANTFGTFSMVFSAAGLFAIVGVMGQQTQLLRSWSEYAESGRLAELRGVLKFGAVAVMVGTLVVATAFLLVLSRFVPMEYAVAATAYLVSQSLVTVSAHLVRTAVGILIGDGLAVIFAQVPALAYISWQLGQGEPADLAYVFALMAAGGFLAFAVHAIVMARRIITHFPELLTVRGEASLPALTASSIKLWGSQILEVSSQYLDVLVVGWLMDPASAGAYFVITRLANGFAVISSAIYLSTTRHMPAAYFAGDGKKLATILNSVSVVNLFAIVGGLLLFLVAGAEILSWFGAQWTEQHANLLVLCVGSALAASSFPSTSLLNISGNEGSYLRVLAIAVAVRLVAFAVLVPAFDVSGAVLASTMSLALLGIGVREAAIRLTGLDGSVFRLWRPAMQRLAGRST